MPHIEQWRKFHMLAKAPAHDFTAKLLPKKNLVTPRLPSRGIKFF
jgi:hypothetical protein